MSDGPKNASMALFQELKIDDTMTLKNRMVLAPLTRGRAVEKRTANDLMAEYYKQRSGAGLLITEATGVSDDGHGWFNAPACYTKAHAEGWKKTTKAVHDAGSYIFLQQWHMGRAAHSSFHESKRTVAPSAIKISGDKTTSTVDGSQSPYEMPEAMTTEEVKATVEDYRKCAVLAKEAGFDGIEIHCANGYLLDEFLQSRTNERTDCYGGSVANRCRAPLEVLEAVKTVFPSNRIGIRISPNGNFNDMGSADNHETFLHFAAELENHGLAYLHIMDGLGFGCNPRASPMNLAMFRKVYSGNIIGNVGLTRDIAEGMLRSGAMDLACFGRLYISNPDLDARFLNDWPLNADSTYADWWTKSGADGYTSFPAYNEKKDAAEAKEAK